MPTFHLEYCIISWRASVVGDMGFTHLCMFLTDEKIKTCHLVSSHRTTEWNSDCPKLMHAVSSHFSHAEYGVFGQA